MDMKSYLDGVIARCDTSLADLEQRNAGAQTVDEVRSIAKEIERVKTERMEAQRAIDGLAVEERGFNPIASYTVGKVERSEDVDPYSTMEYRMAFKQFVQTGKADFPVIEQRANEFTITDDIGKIIPNTILNEFIKQVGEKHGQIYAKVRKLAIKGGVEIPISDLGATATWIGETEVSETKKAGTINASISFKYHTLELRMAQTLLSSIVSLDMFEQEIVRIMVEAFAKEMDMMILTGSGTAQPLGILNDPRVTQVVEMTEEEFSDWTAWRKKLFAEIPLAKSAGGEFLFTKATWQTYIMCMKDGENRPLAKEGADVSDGPFAGVFYGLPATFVEPIAIKNMATAEAGDVVGVYWVPNDYIVNTNLQLAYKRWFDDDKNQYINKGIVITDGKIADTAGCYIIKKKVSA